MPQIPTSDHTWIADVLDGLRRRSRALKHKTQSVECERVFEETHGARTERVDIALRQRSAGRGFVLRAKIWEDRWTWIDAREGGRSGWIFEWTTEGRTAGGLSGQGLVRAIEETFDAISIAGTADHLTLTKIWKAILLRGPKPVCPKR